MCCSVLQWFAVTHSCVTELIIEMRTNLQQRRYVQHRRCVAALLFCSRNRVIASCGCSSVALFLVQRRCACCSNVALIAATLLMLQLSGSCFCNVFFIASLLLLQLLGFCCSFFALVAAMLLFFRAVLLFWLC